jgi:tRNA(Ile)-lysidine synthase
MRRTAPSPPRPARAKRLPADRLDAAFAAAVGNFADGQFAVAVSGGSDSLALMHLLATHAKAARRVLPIVLTVDHGLRKGSARDAAQVLAWAKALGLEAHRLAWRGTKPANGIEAAAREARYRLMGAWLKKNRIATLFVAHTQDDQAETFLLRLARGSGLDGLAAMRALSPWPVPGFEDLSVARPLLGLGRAELRALLERRGQAWLDDPMNDDPRFDRVKFRRAAALLADAGLTAARIADAAAHLGRAREALEAATEAVLLRACRAGREGEGILLDPDALAAAPRELGLRALARLLMRVGNKPYRPRFDSLERLFGNIGMGTLSGGVTLHGCRIAPAAARLRIFGPQTLVIAPESSRGSARSKG